MTTPSPRPGFLLCPGAVSILGSCGPHLHPDGAGPTPGSLPGRPALLGAPTSLPQPSHSHLPPEPTSRLEPHVPCSGPGNSSGPLVIELPASAPLATSLVRPQVWSVTAVLCTPSSSAPVLLFPGQVPTERCPLSEPLLRPDPVPLSRSREGTGVTSASRPLASTAVSSQDLASPGIKGVVQAGLSPPARTSQGGPALNLSPHCVLLGDLVQSGFPQTALTWFLARTSHALPPH